MRDWTVLIIGGASGTGKSTIAYALAKHYGISVLEFDDIKRTVETMVNKSAETKKLFPAIHDPDGDNWQNLGIEWNVNWLKAVSMEMEEFLVELVNRHVDEDIPFIIEGDFILPEPVKPLLGEKVKALFVQEADAEQITRNYQAREGGDAQSLRAEISVTYNNWLKKSCEDLGIHLLESRPWDSALQRAIELLEQP